MNPTATLLRWYRQSTSGAIILAGTYTADEVHDLLRPDSEGASDRAAAVRAMASQPGRWLGRVTSGHRREIGDLADRLPALVFHHTLGRPTEELVTRFGGWGTWRYHRALEVACACIAGQLNRTTRLAA
jgi:hypothetical protein